MRFVIALLIASILCLIILHYFRLWLFQHINTYTFVKKNEIDTKLSNDLKDLQNKKNDELLELEKRYDR